MPKKLDRLLRGINIGRRITLMTGINILVACLFFTLAWWGVSRMNERMRDLDQLREQSSRVDAISKKSQHLLLLAWQYMLDRSGKAVTQLAIYGPELERFIKHEAQTDPALKKHAALLLTELQRFQRGFNTFYNLKLDQEEQYDKLMELGDTLNNFLGIVSANARGEGAYDLLPELEKAQRWLQEALATVNRYYFSGKDYASAQNDIQTLLAYIPALADRAGNSLRTRYLTLSTEILEQYHNKLSWLIQAKSGEQMLVAEELNAPQIEIQNIINETLRQLTARELANAADFRKELERATILGLSLVAGLILCSGLLSWAIGRSIVAPLTALHQAIKRQAEGQQVRNLPMHQGDDELAAMAGTLRRVIELQAEKDGLITALREAKDDISTALTRLRNLLDNTGQGILSFGPDLVVEREYSRESGAIFGHEAIHGHTVDTLLHPGAPEERATLARNLTRICGETDAFKRDILLSLMPGEFSIHDKTVEVQYRPLGAGRMMLLLTDVSQARRLQHAVETEGKRLALVVAAVKNRDELLNVLDDMRSFLRELQRGGTSPDEGPQPDAAHISRLLHTYKGLFALMDCVHLPHALHEAETRIEACCARADGEPSAEEFLRALSPETLLQAADGDMEIIRQTLGDSFLQTRGEVVLSPGATDKLLELAGLLSKHFSGATPTDLLPGLELLRHLRYQDIRQLLDRYPRMALQLAERLDKELAPFSVEGDEVLVDHNAMVPFVRGLVHVFRNAVDHGLETREERLLAGKEEAGNMGCEVRKTRDGGLELHIWDDGRGIDVEALQQVARKKGLELPANPLELLFAQGLSTVDVRDAEHAAGDGANTVSGRGVGLAALREELWKLNGDVEIRSEQGRGTHFFFRIPQPVEFKGVAYGLEG